MGPGKIILTARQLGKACIQQTSRNCCSQVPGVNKYTKRSHTCGQLTSVDVGKEVSLSGWLEYKRMDKFAILRDAYGSTQLIIPEHARVLMDKLKETPLESVISVKGLVQPRPEPQVNKSMSTGEVEVVLNDYSVVGPVTVSNLPFSIRDFLKPKEQVRLTYRYLDLRFPQMQKILRARSNFLMKMREFLVNERAFVEVETPTLFRRTPGGAQEFIVPTRHPGEFYSLVQSPQQLKQLLMVGGVDRYFQVARCYRDEGGKPNRQPEFTQLDVELSFGSGDGVMNLIEELLAKAWPRQLVTPFPRLSYKEAMESYGTDKPDLRFSNKILNLGNIIFERNQNISKNSSGVTARGIIFSKGASEFKSAVRKSVDELRRKLSPGVLLIDLKIRDSTEDEVVRQKLSVNLKRLREEFSLSEGDLMLIAVGGEKLVLDLLGRLRPVLLEKLGFTQRKENEDNFLWVTDFPLFIENDEGQIESAHHPFTAPHADDLHLMKTNPLQVRGVHYDLVLNGNEVGGGSERIHDSLMQEYVLKEILKTPTDQLAHLLEALGSGAPPHAGIALGIDRLVACMVHAQSIRDVIAFPKTGEGRDLMCLAPSKVTQEELDLYNIKVREVVQKKESIV